MESNASASKDCFVGSYIAFKERPTGKDIQDAANVILAELFADKVFIGIESIKVICKTPEDHQESGKIIGLDAGVASKDVWTVGVKIAAYQVIFLGGKEHLMTASAEPHLTKIH